MKMSRQWMYDDRCSPQFVEGVHTFLLVAEANKRADGFMPCPCAGSKNDHNYSKSRTIHVHLFESGFMPHYNVWTKHRERGVMMEMKKKRTTTAVLAMGSLNMMIQQWGKKLSRQCGKKLKKRHQMSPLMI